jgi:hypothetical protein
MATKKSKKKTSEKKPMTPEEIQSEKEVNAHLETMDSETVEETHKEMDRYFGRDVPLKK